MSTPHFPRNELARQMADELMGLTSFSDAANGLFLAAPRRTGKSQFLQRDLTPELKERGVTVIYVDLWEDKRSPPLKLIAAKVRETILDGMGPFAKWVRDMANSWGMTPIAIPGTGVRFDLDKIGATDGLSIYEVIKLMHQQSQQPVAIIIDEAQHALTSDSGEEAMAALKSARDQLRGVSKEGDQPGLLLVMSGSHRDKLMRLVNREAAPFFGSEVRGLPLLGRNFTNDVARRIRQEREQLLSIDDERLFEAFEHCGSRPQVFFTLLGETLRRARDAKEFNDHIVDLAKQRRAKERLEKQEQYFSCAPLPRAILRRMLEQGEAFKPFAAAALGFYREESGEDVSAGQVQKALEELRCTDPPLLWKSTRGGYAPYDQEMQEWYVYLCNAGRWPPQATGDGEENGGD